MLSFDYADILCRQCEIISRALLGEKTDGGEKLFSEISKKLAKDFLPPIDREDIAAISLAIYDIGIKAEEYSESLKGKAPNIQIRKQTDFLPSIIKGLLGKKKTCGDDIRRFIDMNVESRKYCNSSAASLNNALADFIKTVNSAFFKNL